MDQNTDTRIYVARDGLLWALCSQTWTASGWRLSRLGTYRTRALAREAKREAV